MPNYNPRKLNIITIIVIHNFNTSILCMHSINCTLLNVLFPWSKVFIEKLIGDHVIKELTAFYGTGRLITVFIKARCWTLS
jgi:hypothetical protein